MNKFIVTMLLFFGISAGVTSCELLGTPDLVLTTTSQVLPDSEYEVVPTEQLPKEMLVALPEGEVIVMTGRENLKPESTFVALGPSSEEGNLMGLVRTAVGIGSAFIPGLAAWEGVLTLFSKRKRKHYIEATRKASPITGPMDLKGAMDSVLAAIGSGHSSKSSEAAFEAETS